jgi:ribonuclease P protein component
MVPRALRIHRTTDILRIMRQGDRWRFGTITLYGIRSGEQVLSTVIIDKKVSKKAVVRNKVKRQLRELLQQAEIPCGKYVLRGYSGVETMDWNALSEAMRQISVKVARD